MNAQERNAEINTLISKAVEMNAKFEQRLEASKGTLLGQGYIVQPHQLPGFVVHFDTEQVKGSYQVVNPHVVGLVHGGYNMFTKEDAVKIAANNFNGAGKAAHAIHIRDAWKEAIEENNKFIAQMKALFTA